MKDKFENRVLPFIRTFLYIAMFLISGIIFFKDGIPFDFANKIPDDAIWLIAGESAILFVILISHSITLTSSISKNYKNYYPEYITSHLDKFNFRKIFLKNRNELDVDAVKWFHDHGILGVCYPLAEIDDDSLLFNKDFEDIPLSAFGTKLSERFTNLALTFDSNGAPILINSDGKIDYGVMSLSRKIDYNKLVLCNSTRNAAVIDLAYGKNFERFKSLKVPYKSLYNFIWFGVKRNGGDSVEIERATRLVRIRKTNK